MAIARLFLPLLILVGLALFALQNWSPVLPLVIAGIGTQALPLALWMLAAIAAGAATTVAVSTLFSLTRFTAVRRSNKQRPAVAQSHAQSYNQSYRPEEKPSSRPWANTWANRAPANPGTKTRLQPEEDWDNRRSREEWDDWDEDSTEAQSPNSQSFNAQSPNAPPEIRDRSDEDWDNWEGYTDEERAARRPPVRTDFEAKQSPAAQKQSGSLYSVSYEKAEPQRPTEVYDADYRVIVPPFADAPPKASEFDDEDWGFDDDDIPDEPRDRPSAK